MYARCFYLSARCCSRTLLDRSSQKRIFPTTYVVLNGVELFKDGAELEGIVAKRVDSPIPPRSVA